MDFFLSYIFSTSVSFVASLVASFFFVFEFLRVSLVFGFFAPPRHEQVGIVVVSVVVAAVVVVVVVVVGGDDGGVVEAMLGDSSGRPNGV